jgi:hypothetical protein
MLEGLAKRFCEPIEIVEQVYRAELVSVESQARIRAFLPIIARRRAKDVLRHRRAR